MQDERGTWWLPSVAWMRLPRSRAWQPAVREGEVAEVIADNRHAWVERELLGCALVGPDAGAQLRALVHGARCTCHRCR
jgi:hypothetical protein